MAKSKLTVGSPWYSRGWGGAAAGPNGDGLFQNATGYIRGTWDDTTTPAPGGQFPWWYVKTLENNDGWQKHFDEVSMVPYLYRPSDGGFLTYEDERSLAARCDFVLDNGYGGIIVWEISGDDLNGSKTMTNIVYDKLYRSNPTSIEEAQEDAAAAQLFTVQVFPNPTTDLLYVNASADANARVLSMDGRTMLAASLHQGVNRLSLGSLSGGMYLLCVESDGAKQVIKVSVK